MCASRGNVYGVDLDTLLSLTWSISINRITTVQ
jgi:hypothetical protein